MIGKTINNYLIEHKLGDGGMGEVYYAKHTKVDREVAIKILHSHLFNNESIHNRFKNEANALIKLNHPNIVKIFDYVEQDNFACLIMEYINGYTLDDYIAKISGPLPSEKAVSIISPVLDAVQYAHDNNVFHRDIKPSNIMISKDGNKVRIMDFGIAKLTDSKNYKTTHANTQLGTPFYMSPEQIKGLPYSRMSDIYSLGITLFEMVTGKCPYHGITSLFELQSKIVNQSLPCTDEFYPEVNQRIQNAISIATQKKPELRFQNCNDFKKYLQEKDVLLTPGRVVKPLAINKAGDKARTTYIFAGIAFFIIIVLVLIFAGNMPEKPEITYKSLKMTQPPVVTEIPGNNKDTVPPSSPESSQPSIQDRNINTLNIYIESKEKVSGKKLSENQRNKLIKEIKLSQNLISQEELGKKYDSYFIAVPRFPSSDQIVRDFWDSLRQMKYPCRVPFESDEQISEISIDRSYKKTGASPKEIAVTVNFRISPTGEEVKKISCSVVLRYYKSGLEYKLVE